MHINVLFEGQTVQLSFSLKMYQVVEAQTVANFCCLLPFLSKGSPRHFPREPEFYAHLAPGYFQLERGKGAPEVFVILCTGSWSPAANQVVGSVITLSS